MNLYHLHVKGQHVRTIEARTVKAARAKAGRWFKHVHVTLDAGEWTLTRCLHEGTIRGQGPA